MESKSIPAVSVPCSMLKGWWMAAWFFATVTGLATEETKPPDKIMRTLVIAPPSFMARESAGSFVSLAHSSLVDMGYRQMEVIGVTSAFQSQELPRHVALFVEGCDTGTGSWVIFQWVDLETAELCGIRILPLNKKSGMDQIVKEMVLGFGDLLPSRKGQLKSNSPLLTILHFSVQMDEKNGVDVQKAYGRLMAAHAAALYLKRRDIFVISRSHPKEILLYQQLCGLPNGGFYNVNTIYTGEISQLGDVSFVVGKLIDIKTGGVMERSEVEMESLEKIGDAAKTLFERLNIKISSE